MLDNVSPYLFIEIVGVALIGSAMYMWHGWPMLLFVVGVYAILFAIVSEAQNQ